MSDHLEDLLVSADQMLDAKYGGSEARRSQAAADHVMRLWFWSEPVSQKAFAESVGLSPNTVRSVGAMEHRPSDETIGKLYSATLRFMFRSLRTRHDAEEWV